MGSRRSPSSGETSFCLTKTNLSGKFCKNLVIVPGMSVQGHEPSYPLTTKTEERCLPRTACLIWGQIWAGQDSMLSPYTMRTGNCPDINGCPLFRGSKHMVKMCSSEWGGELVSPTLEVETDGYSIRRQKCKGNKARNSREGPGSRDWTVFTLSTMYEQTITTRKNTQHKMTKQALHLGS